MSIRWSYIVAPTNISRLRRLPVVPIFLGVTTLLASTQLRFLSVMAFTTALPYLFRTAALGEAMAALVLQYILGFGTWYGLSTIGEPPLTKSQPCGEGGSCRATAVLNQAVESQPSQEPMPAWLIFLFFALVATRYIFSFLFAYVFQVISTVIMVSSEDVSALGAARARRHPAARVPPANAPANERPLRRPTRIGTFQPRFLTMSKRSLTRSLTMPIESLGKKFFGLACLRGLNAYLIMSVAQWYLGAITDFFLSGQPKELMPGYGSSSIVLAIFFAGGSAIWTHYAITKPSSRDIQNLVPQGSDIILELFPITCLWAICEQITMSLPLAMSRSGLFELRQYAWTPSSWNLLNSTDQRTLLFKFTLVYLTYLLLTATFSIPSTMMLRRIHASMLPEASESIIPYTRGNPQPRDNDEDNITHTPGLSVSQAWATITWRAYFRVVRIYVQYFLINQLIHFVCWEADWRLHDFFQTDQYASPFPSGSPSRLALRIFE